MAASILDILAEKSRQTRTGDEFYYKKLPWVFRIKVRDGSFVGPTGADGEALFPLPIAPNQFEYDLPFASEISPQQEGGVVSEEAGFVIGEIRINATTGWKLRPERALTFSAEHGRFTGGLGTSVFNFDAISGQMQFWILAQRCFEGYSELKKDPEYGPKTKMELHVMKDHLHLEVIPRKFKLTRGAEKERVTYRYEIVLSVVGEAEEIDYESPSDKDLFDQIADTINSVRQAVQSIAAAIDDITAAIGELERFATGIASIVDDLKSIVDAGTNFVNGVKNFLDIPSQTIANVTDLVESTATLFETTATVPADVYQTFLNVVDELDRLKVAARDHFTEAWDEVSAKYNTETNPAFSTDVSDTVQEQIDDKAEAGESAQGQMTINSAFGGPVKPGDKKRQEISRSEGRLSGREYNGFTERVVGQGDTIQSLSAKHLGDARKWLDLAIINRLKPPFITSGARIPNTLSVGDRISIPIAKPSKPTNILTDGQIIDRSSQIDSHLGTDFELVPIPGRKNRWGWQIDFAHGAVDATKVRGVDCVSQGLAARLRTTRGENILFPNVGLPRLVGGTQLGDESIEARFRARQQMMADPRVSRIIRFSFGIIGDSLYLNAEIQPVGFSSARTISRIIT